MAGSLSQKKQNTVSYHEKTRLWDQTFQKLNLDRPQDTNPKLLQRSRQINFGVISCTKNEKEREIEDYEPPYTLIKPVNKWKCYPSGRPDPRWVDTTEKFQKMVSRISSCAEITVDLEVHNYRTMTDFVSLIQIGTWNFGDYIIDPFKVREEITSMLKPLLESTGILKIGHNLTNDVRWMQKDFGVFMVAAVDTQIMYKLLHGETQIGFQKLACNCHHELVHLLSKETLIDWRLRPGSGMTKEQEIYATNDVHVLLRVFDQLRSEMYTKDPEGGLFQKAVKETRGKLLCISENLKGDPDSIKCYQSEATEELHKLESGKSHLQRQISKLSEATRELFLSLLEWRGLLAKILDDKPQKILPTEKLMLLATTTDKSIERIKFILGEVDKRIYDKHSNRAMQAGIIQKLLESTGTYIEEVRKHECHNCLKTGHGPAWACPFPKIKENYKKWFKRPENEQFRHKQFGRRRQALVNKVGEKTADKIIASTRTN